MPNEVTEILSSENPSGDRLWTALMRSPKFIHQETLRHRTLYIEDCLHDPDFSFSVSSLRAIPFAKMLAEVRSDELRAAPVYWGAEQKGMSPGEELSDYPSSINESVAFTSPRMEAQICWGRAAMAAAHEAEKMASLGVHKSICNRIIEPYIHVNAGVTGTTRGWMNFFGLRLDTAADPTLRDLAEKAWALWNESKPQKLQPGQWHLPFVDEYEVVYDAGPMAICKYPRLPFDIAVKVSVARMARLSYLSFETQKRSTVEEDLTLYNRLVGASPIHASPAEHQATPDIWYARQPTLSVMGVGTGSINEHWDHPEQAGNLGPGWRQFRKMLPGEAVAPLPERYR